MTPMMTLLTDIQALKVEKHDDDDDNDDDNNDDDNKIYDIKR